MFIVAELMFYRGVLALLDCMVGVGGSTIQDIGFLVPFDEVSSQALTLAKSFPNIGKAIHRLLVTDEYWCGLMSAYQRATGAEAKFGAAIKSLVDDICELRKQYDQSDESAQEDAPLLKEMDKLLQSFEQQSEAWAASDLRPGTVSQVHNMVFDLLAIRARPLLDNQATWAQHKTLFDSMKGILQSLGKANKKAVAQLLQSIDECIGEVGSQEFSSQKFSEPHTPRGPRKPARIP